MKKCPNCRQLSSTLLRYSCKIGRASIVPQQFLYTISRPEGGWGRPGKTLVYLGIGPKSQVSRSSGIGLRRRSQIPKTKGYVRPPTESDPIGPIGPDRPWNPYIYCKVNARLVTVLNDTWSSTHPSVNVLKTQSNIRQRYTDGLRFDMALVDFPQCEQAFARQLEGNNYPRPPSSTNSATSTNWSDYGYQKSQQPMCGQQGSYSWTDEGAASWMQGEPRGLYVEDERSKQQPIVRAVEQRNSVAVVDINQTSVQGVYAFVEFLFASGVSHEC